MIHFDENLDIIIPFDQDRIHKELFYYLEAPGRLSGRNMNNFIVKFFQQDVFYAVEKDMCRDDYIFAKIVANIMKYLNKDVDDLTSEDILQGFKRCGMHYGYSHFNPLIAKWFYKRYGIKTCYDPCGGWGHRLLGSLDLDLYIYNDLSTPTYENVLRIIDWIDAQCITKCYNENAFTFTPEEDFEVMFTCPPYFNLEHYPCGDFDCIETYHLFIDCLFDCFMEKESCKYFGMVIREDYLPDMYKEVAQETFDISQNRCQHISKGGEHKNKEKLYVFFK